jgi:hypothetical protein
MYFTVTFANSVNPGRSYTMNVSAILY